LDKFILILLVIIIFIIIILKLKISTCINQSDSKQYFKSIIENHISESNVRSECSRANIDIKAIEIIDNKVEVLLTFDDVMGEAQLTKGFGNKYRVEHLGKGNIFIYSIIKIKDNKYLVIKGKNYDKSIDKILVTLDNKRYEFKIGTKGYFIVYCNVPKETLCEFPSDFQLLDEKNHNITYEVYSRNNKLLHL
jgi:hypothetical protein